MASRWWTFHRNSSTPALDKSKRIEVQKWSETVADMSKDAHREQEQPTTEAKQRRTPHYVASTEAYRHSDYFGSHPDKPQQSRPSRPQSSVNLSSTSVKTTPEKPKLRRKSPIKPFHVGHRSTPSFEIQPDFRTAPLHLRKNMSGNDQVNQTQWQPQPSTLPDRAVPKPRREMSLIPSTPPAKSSNVPHLPEISRINSAPSSAAYDRVAFREADIVKKDTSPPVASRHRGASVTSGSSAYTAFIDGAPSSPSSHDHTYIWPPSSTVPTVGKTSTGPIPVSEPQTSRQRPLTASPGSRPLPLSAPLPGTRVRAQSQNMVPPHRTPTGPVAAYPSPKTATNANFGGISSPPPTGTQPYSSYPAGTSHRRDESSDSSSAAHARVGLEALRPYPRTNSTPMMALAPPPRRQTKKPTPVSHACLSLGRTDRLRLIKFPPSIVQAIKTAIQRSWTKGLQDEKEHSGSIEFQLRGNPWVGQGDEAVPSVYMMCEIMSTLYHLGWNLVMATDISKRAMDKDTLIYKQGDIPSPCLFMAVTFSEGDRLRLIRVPNEVINAVKNVWGGNIQKESWKLQNIAWEFKLSGYPWWSSGDEAIAVRLLLMNMLDAMHGLGWELHTSVDITAGPGGLGKNAGADTDCWIFRKLSS